MADQGVIGTNYFDHQFLRKDDFECAREHHVTRLRQHNRVLHSYGIVDGLTLTRTGDQQMRLQGGVAIDLAFTEVVLGETPPGGLDPVLHRDGADKDVRVAVDEAGGVNLDIGAGFPASDSVYVAIQSGTEPTDPTSELGVNGWKRIVERPLITITRDAPASPALIVGRADRGPDGKLAGNNGDEFTDGRVYASSHLADGSITEEKLADNAITTRTIAAGAVGPDDIADGAVVEGKLGPKAVQEGNIDDEAVSSRTIARAAVNADKLDTGSVGNDALQQNAVQKQNIDTNAVTTDAIAAANVTEPKLAPGAVSSRALGQHVVGLQNLSPDVIASFTVADDGVTSSKIAEADSRTGQDTSVGAGVKRGHIQNAAIDATKLDPAVRAAMAGAFCVFDGRGNGTLLSFHNVAAATKKLDHAGHYLFEWDDDLDPPAQLGILRAGILLDDDLFKFVTGVTDVAPSTESVISALQDALQPPVSRALVSATAMRSLAIATDGGSTTSLTTEIPRPSDGGTDYTPPKPPPTPKQLTVNDIGGNTGNTYVQIGWIKGTLGGPTDGYDIYRDGAYLKSVTTTTYTDATVVQGSTYKYTVQATNRYRDPYDYEWVDQASAFSNEVTATVPDTTPPTTPSGLQAVFKPPNAVTLTWNASSDTVAMGGYTVYRDGVPVATSIQTTAFTDSGLAPSRSYAYYVTARDAAGNQSTPSSTATVYVKDTEAPSMPTGLTATANAYNQVTLGWNAAKDNIGVTGYRVYRNGAQVGAPTTPGLVDTGLTQNTQYTYTVQAYDKDGNISAQTAGVNVTTPWRDPVDVDPPTVPGNLQQSTAPDRVTLSWTASTDNRAVAGYQIVRDGMNLTSVPGNATTYGDATVHQGQSYTYTVAAFDAAGNFSPPSNAVNADVPDVVKPTPPSQLTGTGLHENRVSFVWSASTDNVAVTAYQIFRDGKPIASQSERKYTDAELSANRDYHYVVRAVDAAGNISDASNELVVHTPDETAPTVPGTVQTQPGKAGNAYQVGLTWGGSTDNVMVAGYNVYRDGVRILQPSSTSATDTNVEPWQQYSYAVSARDAAGNESAKTQAVVVQVPILDMPTQPTGLTAEAVSPTRVNLTWTASTSIVSIAEYELFRDGVSIQQGITSGTSFSDVTVKPNTSYTYRVVAYDPEHNASPPSASATATTPPDPTAGATIGPVFAFAYLAGAVRNVQVVTATPGQVEVQVTDGTGAGADGIVNVMAFAPTAEPRPSVGLQGVITKLPPAVLGPVVHEVNPGLLGQLVDILPPPQLVELVPELPPDDIRKVIGVAPDDRLGLIESVVPKDSLPQVITGLDDTKIATLIDNTPDASLSDVVDAIPQNRLGSVLDSVSAVRTSDVVAKLDGTRLDTAVADAGAGTVAQALAGATPDKVATIGESIDTTKLGAVLTSAPAGSLETITAALPDQQLGSALASVSGDDRTALIQDVPADKLGGVLAASTGGTRDALIESTSGAQLADAVLAAPAASQQDLVAAMPATTLADAAASAPASGGRTLVGLASDAQLGSALLAASGDTAQTVAAFVEPTRVESVAQSVPAPQKATVMQLFG